MVFEISHKDKKSKARVGKYVTDHGIINTPIFMPVGTAGTVKAVYQDALEKEIKAQIILGNTYHLFLRPGIDVIKQAGGLHNFISWQRPILTDSGGYQIYSLKDIRKLNEEGVMFNSHIDGSKHFFTPERAIEIQRVIGADIIMAFDECTPFPCDYTYAEKSLNITNNWLLRCIKYHKENDFLYNHKQELFPIVQGSVYKDLRRRSAEFVAQQEMNGNAIGGLSVGEPEEMMYEMTEIVCDILPYDKPRYLMGVGTPVNILQAISLGVDMFDCVMPTRNARNGWLFTKDGIINIKNEKWKFDYSPIDENNYTFVDTYYSKAYLRHLFISKEILASMITSLHNLGFYMWLVTEAQQKIIEGTFYEWKESMIKKLSQKI